MNIVFDLGGVVFNWLPDKLIAQFSADVRIQQLIRTQVLNHPDWLALDRGTALLPSSCFTNRVAKSRY